MAARKTRASPTGRRVHYWIAVLFWLLALVCFLAYRLIGSSIDEDGVLVEPFFLVPLFWLCIVLGCIAFAASLLRSLLGFMKR
jgi:hypothetical protein